jgi:hypothetical protein
MVATTRGEVNTTFMEFIGSDLSWYCVLGFIHVQCSYMYTLSECVCLATLVQV